jgi:Na+-translocating ferredoxin:NAD+ oxidoreductase RNF subunit RnfB
VLCPVDGIAGDRDHLHVINAAVCIKCGVCSDTCSVDAVETVGARP